MSGNSLTEANAFIFAGPGILSGNRESISPDNSGMDWIPSPSATLSLKFTTKLKYLGLGSY